MDLAEFWIQAISNVGFPIVCVIAMFYEMEQERKSHKEESEKWAQSLDRNTDVMEKLLSKLEG